MASKNGKKEAKTNGASFRFINHSLSAKDIEQLNSLDLGLEFPYGLLDELVMEGYKFSLSYDDKNATCVASITDRQQASAFYNCCLTGRGSKMLYKPLPSDDPVQRQPDMTRAETLLHWKPKVSLEEGLSKTMTTARGI
jgi:hypothetical protein